MPDEIALFDAPSATGCAFGALCKRPTDKDTTLNECRICFAKRVHHICCIKCPVIDAVVAEAEMGSYCFDCAVM